MTPEAQRIAIAEACGWTNICLQPLWVSDIEDEFPPVLCGTHPSKGRLEGIPKRFGPLPDYLNDLNAMHEAEKILTEVQFGDYYIEHLKMARGESQYTIDRSMVCATAAQRAEAFLRTIGKWTTNETNHDTKGYDLPWIDFAR